MVRKKGETKTVRFIREDVPVNITTYEIKCLRVETDARQIFLGLMRWQQVDERRRSCCDRGKLRIGYMQLFRSSPSSRRTKAKQEIALADGASPRINVPIFFKYCFANNLRTLQ